MLEAESLNAVSSLLLVLLESSVIQYTISSYPVLEHKGESSIAVLPATLLAPLMIARVMRKSLVVATSVLYALISFVGTTVLSLNCRGLF